MNDHVLIRIEGPALYLTLENVGRKNALSIAVLRQLQSALRSIKSDVTRIVFIQGAGGVFSAGADLNDISGTAKDVDYDLLTQEVCQTIKSIPMPVAALVEGPCMGAAVELALSCDLRIAASDSFFQVPATRLGLLYKPDAIAALHRKFGAEVMMRLMVLGERFTAQSALQAGLVGEVAEAAQLLVRAKALADLAAKTDPTAAGLTKKLLTELGDDTADRVAWRAKYVAMLSSPARKERIEKAKAKSTGAKSHAPQKKMERN